MNPQLRAGHAFVAAQPDGAQLRLSCGSAMMGDVVKQPSDNRLTIEVSVINGDGGQLEICTAQGVVERVVISGEKVELSFEIDVADTSYVRVQLRDGESQSMLALTNPIYVK